MIELQKAVKMFLNDKIEWYKNADQENLLEYFIEYLNEDYFDFTKFKDRSEIKNIASKLIKDYLGSSWRLNVH